MRKRVLSLALAFVLTLALVSAFTTPAQAAGTWQEAYANQLKNPGDATDFALVNLDGDSTPELLLFRDLKYGGAILEGIYTFTTRINSLSFENMAYEFHRVPADSGCPGLFSQWMSGNGRSGETYFLTVEGGKVKSTPVYSYALGNIGFGGTDEGMEIVHDQSLNDLYNKSPELTLCAITPANIKAYLTDTAAPATANPHYYAAALGAFIKGATETAAVLVDLNNDGVDEMVAIKDANDGYSSTYEVVVFDQRTKKEPPASFQMNTGGGQIYISNKNYIILELAVAFGPIYPYGYENGQLPLKVEWAERGEETYDYYPYEIASGKEISRAVMNEKYGIGSKKYMLTGSGRADQTTEILKMTDSPSGKTAVPTASTVYVNGKAIAFEGYNIEDNNYFKLRDLAKALSGSEKQFEVGYDDNTKAITLTRGKAYTPAGGELAKGDGKEKTVPPTESKIYLDGKELDFTVYNINGNNFFKLRDLMEVLNVNVGYDAATKNITLDTSKDYVG